MRTYENFNNLFGSTKPVMSQARFPSYLAEPLNQPTECVACRHQSCRAAAQGTLEICDFGIAFYNDNGQIKKRRKNVTMRHIAANLRHELDKVLQFIINEASEIDDSVSLRQLDTSNPASRIVGATVILDKFIEMISGVYDFAPNRDPGSMSAYPPLPLQSTIQRYVDVYSLIKNTRRADDLKIDISIDPILEVPVLGPVVEYLIALLADNIWKYAPNESQVTISCEPVDENVLDLCFRNNGHPLPPGRRIFEKGYKLDVRSEGFGFGLYWATILCDHFNTVSQRSTQPLTLEHTETPSSATMVRHEFRVKNLPFRARR